MCVGNHVGLQLSNDLNLEDLFQPAYGAVILELLDPAAGEFLGFTTVDYTLEAEGNKIDLAHLQELWEAKLEPVFPYRKKGDAVQALNYECPANERVHLPCGWPPRGLSFPSSPAPTVSTIQPGLSAVPAVTRTCWS